MLRSMKACPLEREVGSIPYCGARSLRVAYVWKWRATDGLTLCRVIDIPKVVR